MCFSVSEQDVPLEEEKGTSRANRRNLKVNQQMEKL